MSISKALRAGQQEEHSSVPRPVRREPLPSENSRQGLLTWGPWTLNWTRSPLAVRTRVCAR